MIPARTRFSFTLRRAFACLSILCVIMAGVRWWYVRVYTQVRVTAELKSFEARVEYSNHYLPASERNWAGHGPAWFVPSSRSTLAAVNGVNISVPFRTLEDAKQVNHLLHQLPYLADVRVHSSGHGSRTDDYEQRTGEHLVEALNGLPISGLVIQNDHVSVRHMSRFLPTLDRLKSVCFQNKAPSLEVLETICKHPSLRSFSSNTALSGDHVRVLAKAQQLRRIHVSVASADGLTELAKLQDCDIELFSQTLTDEHLKNVVSKMPNLVGLGLWRSEVTDEGVRSLAAADALREMSLQDVEGITDQAIGDFASHPSLEYLNLMGTQVTEQGVIDLCSHSHVRKIIVPEHHSWDNLKAALPEVEVSVDQRTDLKPKVAPVRSRTAVSGA